MGVKLTLFPSRTRQLLRVGGPQGSLTGAAPALAGTLVAAHGGACPALPGRGSPRPARRAKVVPQPLWALPGGAAGVPAPCRENGAGARQLRSGFGSTRARAPLGNPLCARGGAPAPPGRDVTGALRQGRPVAAARGQARAGAMAAGYQHRPNGGGGAPLPDPSFLWNVFQR